MTYRPPSIAAIRSYRRSAPIPLSETTDAISRGDDTSRAPALVVLPAGSFVMGAGADDKFATDTERPRHVVRFGYRFALGLYPVTVGEYRDFAPLHAPDEDDALPVANVSWQQATAYCAWLRAATERPFRLPTEAEWEYACRAGNDAPFSTGARIDLRDANFLYSEQGERIGVGQRQPVGSYVPNAYGLYDLHGNVGEWVEDLWHPNYLGAPMNGSAWLNDSPSDRRVIRGGAWDHLPRLLRCAGRDALSPTARHDNVGFRVALTLPA